MKRIDEVEEGVKRCHGGIRKGQVDDEVVGYGPHASVSEDDPDHSDVPGDGHQDDEGVGDGPQSHLRGRGKGGRQSGKGRRTLGNEELNHYQLQSASFRQILIN